MKKGTFALCLAFAFTLVLGVDPVLAFECPDMYAECQELLKTKKNEEAKDLCEKGIKLHESGKHEEAVETLNAALDLLEKK
ncbi:MAG: hypothetical protein ACE5K9_09555 [Candidatus Methylomirabilales bacterium]